ncbi:MAG: hypothetical protein K2Q12_08800 [Rickettsiales bacterium]|nr:hypothetical protein [Rickettsiales bacterium]
MTYQFIPLDDRAVLHISGDDRAEFLQGLITNDITQLTPQHSLFAALLSAQGKFQFDFFLSADADGFLLETDRARLPALQRLLSLYKLRSRVTLTPMSDAVVAALTGGNIAAHFGLCATVGSAITLHVPQGQLWLCIDPRHAAMGVRVIAQSQAALDAFEQAHGLERQPFTTYEMHRLQEGIPEGSRDAVVDHTLLLENGYDALNGISFTKGCYVGQEVTARSKHRATLRKRLCRVTATQTLPAATTTLMAGEREIGEMRSSCGMMGMALVRLDMMRQALHQEQTITADGIALEASPLWWHPPEASDDEAQTSINE